MCEQDAVWPGRACSIASLRSSGFSTVCTHNFPSPGASLAVPIQTAKAKTGRKAAERQNSKSPVVRASACLATSGARR
eukprot:1421-Chlamydomonas_euryale.AAC.4